METLHALKAINSRMRRLSFWAGVFAVAAPEGPLRGQLRGQLRAGTVVTSASVDEDEGAWFTLLDGFWRRMAVESPWPALAAPPPDELGFRLLSRRQAWEETLRGAIAFGPVAGRARRLADIRAELHRAFRALGHHDQPRDGFAPFQPLRRQGEGWRHEHPGACAVANALVVVTPHVLACIFTGEDD